MSDVFWRLCGLRDWEIIITKVKHASEKVLWPTVQFLQMTVKHQRRYQTIIKMCEINISLGSINLWERVDCPLKMLHLASEKGW